MRNTLAVEVDVGFGDDGHVVELVHGYIGLVE
jgi:hypothetical protein